MEALQKQEEKTKKEAVWSGTMSSGGRLHLSLYFKNLSEEEIVRELAGGIASVSKKMLAD